MLESNKLSNDLKVASSIIILETDSNAFIEREITKHQLDIINHQRQFQNSRKFRNNVINDVKQMQISRNGAITYFYDIEKEKRSKFC